MENYFFVSSDAGSAGLEPSERATGITRGGEVKLLVRVRDNVELDLDG